MAFLLVLVHDMLSLRPWNSQGSVPLEDVQDVIAIIADGVIELFALDNMGPVLCAPLPKALSKGF